MMKKLFWQGGIMVLLFLTSFYIVREIDWVRYLKIESVTSKTEEKLGTLIWDIIKKTEKIVNDKMLVNTIDSLVTHIAYENDIDREFLKVHIVENKQINAFALPYGYIVIYTGLIKASDNPDELCAVISHEIAHVQLDHVMTKLIRELGLSLVISMTTGGTSAEAIMEAAKLLSSTAFDRNMEKQADLKAIDYMIKAEVNPKALADFFIKLSRNTSDFNKYMTLISTHPDFESRINYIEEHIGYKSYPNSQIIDTNTWNILKSRIE